MTPRPVCSHLLPLECARTPPLTALLLTLGLVGCGEGGSAGDAVTDPDRFTVNPIETLVGTWSLAGDWNGSVGGEALLVIPPVGEDGTSEARLYELDNSTGNCYFRPDRGTAEPDPLRGEEVFMNGIFPFNDAVLARDGSTLTITYFDSDGTGCRQNTDGLCVYRAESVAQLEADIQVCEL